MENNKQPKKSISDGVLSIAAPIFTILFPAVITLLFFPFWHDSPKTLEIARYVFLVLNIVVLIFGLIKGIKGLRSNDRKAKTFSIIGIIINPLELIYLVIRNLEILGL